MAISSSKLVMGIQELSTLVISEETLPTALDRVVKLATSLIPGANAVAITMIKDEVIKARDYDVETAAFSEKKALDIDKIQYEADEGPCLEAIRQGDVFLVENLELDERWPGFKAGALAAGLQSSLSLPLVVGGGTVGALNIYSFEKGSFDEQDLQLGRTFAAQAAVALANVQVYQGAKALAENLTEAMRSRAVIEQAKGMIMMQRGCNDEEAFQTLVAASQARNQKLRDIAHELVLQAEQGNNEDPGR